MFMSFCLWLVGCFLRCLGLWLGVAGPGDSNVKEFLVILGIDPVLDANARKFPQAPRNRKRPQIAAKRPQKRGKRPQKTAKNTKRLKRIKRLENQNS